MYELRTEGSCGRGVTSLAECNAAAAALGLGNGPAEDDGQQGVDWDPPYCYSEGGSLKFNSNGLNKGECGFYDVCLCTLAPVPTLAPVSAIGSFCGFEQHPEPASGAFCGLWTNVAAQVDEFDWVAHAGPTLSSGTGPEAATEGSRYLYIEASSPRRPGDTAILRSSPLVIRGPTVMTFQYHMLGAGMGSLKVLLREVGSAAAPREAWRRTGDQGAEWLPSQVDLGPYVGSIVEVSFVGERGQSYASDAAIDAVAFVAGGAAA